MLHGQIKKLNQEHFRDSVLIPAPDDFTERIKASLENSEKLRRDWNYDKQWNQILADDTLHQAAKQRGIDYYALNKPTDPKEIEERNKALRESRKTKRATDAIWRDDTNAAMRARRHKKRFQTKTSAPIFGLLAAIAAAKGR